MPHCHLGRSRNALRQAVLPLLLLLAALSAEAAKPLKPLPLAGDSSPRIGAPASRAAWQAASSLPAVAPGRAHGRSLAARWQKPPRITRVAVLGERHTGTNFLEALLRDNLEVPVQSWLITWKHWFQLPGSERLCVTCPRAPPTGGHNFSSTLVIATFRNPHDWVLAMHERCWNCDAKGRQAWQQFISTPWVEPDQPPGSPKPANKNPQIYETNPWAAPGGPSAFPHLLALRSAKLLHMLNISSWVAGFEAVRHEDVLQPQESLHWLQRVAAKHRLALRHRRPKVQTTYKGKGGKPFDPDRVVAASLFFNATALLDAQPGLAAKVADINRLMDPTVESLLRYQRIDIKAPQ